MALPAAFLDELRARTPLAPLIGRKVKLVRSGRQSRGCCPFHGEKTPSFYVYDDHFHCFGCGAHGDAVGFVMQSQGLAFREAVEVLAGEAGLEVPRPTPAAAEAERRRLDLLGVLGAAATIFARRLRGPEGRRGLDYLHTRGLTDETIDRFGLGWSGEGRGALAAELSRDGVTADQLLQVGLLRPDEQDRPGAELFYNRVMFPIRDRGGRVISFGGRMLGDGQPKYVNGPETPLFSKRRTLFGLDLARAAAASGAPVIVVEGYMDVIALHQAGFAGAVAPLGTAIGAEQLEALWALSPTPVVCLDGDAAGGRAAVRAAELALPLLTAGRTLRLATLPTGQDPDSLVRDAGPGPFQAVLDAARPLSEALFDILREGAGEATPEQRAALRQRLEAAASTIRDRALASEYRRALLDRFFARRVGTFRGGRPKLPPRGPVTPPDVEMDRARTLIAILLNHPTLLHDVDEAFGALDLPPTLARLRDAMLGWASGHASHWDNTADSLDSADLMNHLQSVGLAAGAVQTLDVLGLPACATPAAMPAEAEAGWWHFYGLMDRGLLEDQVRAASMDFAATADAVTQRRLIALCTARDALRRGEHGLALDA